MFVFLGNTSVFSTLTKSPFADILQDAKAYLIGGSIPERDPKDNKVYNTCTIYNPHGEHIATHRKIHLFDIDVPGKIRFQESETLTAGNQLTHFDTGKAFFFILFIYLREKENEERESV